MMKTREVICVECPLACKIQVTMEDDGRIVRIENNRCKRGAAYAAQEVTNPVRVLTSTVSIVTEDQEHPMLPVQTSDAIPKKLLLEAMGVIAKTTVQAPVRYGQVLIPNLLGTGVDVVSTAEVNH
ncbi:DUF1667 domain-containing protein [uncultured Oscillibacter sp.]|uniref:DUF1667 domain-containing protein n=1 Tax=uncultured Oscillibacter sp. TaxID=876091 RepID=UPI0025DD95A0|nr:DUF1667 domain-containing protein [uncultured Oscillibacter sp.]